MSDSQAKGGRKFNNKGKGKETKTHTSDGKPIRRFPKSVKPNNSSEEGVGVSKIKASLRQTRRLLAKVRTFSFRRGFLFERKAGSLLDLIDILRRITCQHQYGKRPRGSWRRWRMN